MIRYAFTTAAALLLLHPSPGQAQNPFIFVGGGLTIPTGDYADATKTGWMGTAGFGVPVAAGKASIGLEGYYGSNSFDVGDGSIDLFGGAAWLAYRFREPGTVSPYLIGSAGALRADAPDPAEPETRFSWSAGVGIDVPVSGSVSLYIEGRYMRAGGDLGIGFIPLFAGLSFSFGGGGGGM